MLAWKTTDSAILDAAAEVGLRVIGPDRTGKTERSSLTFRLRLDTNQRRDDGTLPYQRISTMANLSNGKHRRVAAVCWHGHRDFLRALYRRTPDARIKSALADYHGADDFEQTYRRTYGESNGWNVGLSYGQACVCQEDQL